MINETIKRYKTAIEYHRSKIKWYEEHIAYLNEKKQRLLESGQTIL